MITSQKDLIIFRSYSFARRDALSVCQKKLSANSKLARNSNNVVSAYALNACPRKIFRESESTFTRMYRKRFMNRYLESRISLPFSAREMNLKLLGTNDGHYLHDKFFWNSW